MNLIASLFNLAGPDMLFIFFVILLLFGAKKLPELARGMGLAVKEFNKAKDEIERELSKPADVTVQPAPGQQPRQPGELPAQGPAVAVAAQPPIQPAPPVEQPAEPASQTHPAGQA